MQGIVTFKKIAKEERVKGCRLREDSQGGERKVLLPLKEIISVCVCVCVCEQRKNKGDFYLAVRHTQKLL